MIYIWISILKDQLIIFGRLPESRYHLQYPTLRCALFYTTYSHTLIDFNKPKLNIELSQLVVLVLVCQYQVEFITLAYLKFKIFNVSIFCYSYHRTCVIYLCFVGFDTLCRDKGIDGVQRFGIVDYSVDLNEVTSN